jgi:hypothetical protein
MKLPSPTFFDVSRLTSTRKKWKELALLWCQMSFPRVRFFGAKTRTGNAVVPRKPPILFFVIIVEFVFATKTINFKSLNRKICISTTYFACSLDLRILMEGISISLSAFSISYALFKLDDVTYNMELGFILELLLWLLKLHILLFIL